MKNKIWIFLLFIFLGLNVVWAEHDQHIAGIEARLQVKHSISSQITYPEFAIDNNIEGTVWVSIKINKEGKIEIIEIQATNEMLKKDVHEQLVKMKIKPNVDTETIYDIKLLFQLA